MKKKVLVGGVFDILHPGHVFFLRKAREMGDQLVVVVARDKTVIKEKGRKPIIPEDQRREMVEALKPVDMAILGQEEKMETIKMVKPDLIVLGHDQMVDENKLREELVKHGLDCRVVRLRETYSCHLSSTSQILRQVADWLETRTKKKQVQAKIRGRKMGENPSVVNQLVGEVVPGTGRATKYLMEEGYKKRFEEKLGFTPYPGTLNIKLTKKTVEKLKKVAVSTGIKIDGFSDGGKVFGGVLCLPARVGDIGCAIVFPERSTHLDVVELVAPTNLRQEHKLEDGDRIIVTLWGCRDEKGGCG